MAIAQDMINELARVLASQGSSGDFGRAKDAAAPPLAVRFLIKHPSVRDEAIVNAYGVSAQIITLPALPEFVALPPERFDFIVQQPSDAPYIFDAVVPRIVAGVIVAFTAFVKGKGS